jgi:transcriptional regulator with XRE-family HTH domain
MGNGVFATNLKQIIEALGLNQGEFATRLGVDQATVSCWLNGDRLPTYELLQRIVTLFHVNPQQLFDWEK